MRLNANCDKRHYCVAARAKSGPTSHAYGIDLNKYRAARRVNFLIGRDGETLEEEIYSATRIVDASERTKPKIDATQRRCYHKSAGWSSLVARWAHNPKVGGSNPPPATNIFSRYQVFPITRPAHTTPAASSRHSFGFASEEALVCSGVQLVRTSGLHEIQLFQLGLG